MRLADDDRARVPFAIVGVILVLGSTAYVATVQQRPGSTLDPDAERAAERLDATADAEVSAAVRRAAEAAAREPVVDPADTSAGRVLNESTPFRDYLRLRIYHEVRVALANLHVSTGTVAGEASLPPTPDADALQTAIDRVHLDQGSSGTIHVRIENVTHRLVRGGETIRQRQRTIDRTVSTPVLVLHDRVETFEDRLNRGPLDGPGLGRRLAVRLYALAWARGYLQYAGVPIENVIGTRHVEVTTNSALLATQRSVFGRSDPGGREALRRAVARAGLYDLLAASRTGGEAWLDEVLDLGPGVPSPTGSVPSPGAPSFEPPGPEEHLEVGVNVTADAAFGAYLHEGIDPSLNATLRTVYSADARVVSTVRTVRAEPRPDPDPPAGNWTLVDETVETTTLVSNGTGPEPPVEDGWDRLRSDTRRVELRKTVTWTWLSESGEERQTSDGWVAVYRVGIGLNARHSPTEHAPRRGISTVYERGGPFDGPNLADVERAAVERLVEKRGGPDALAKRAVHDELDESIVRIEGAQPDALSAWVYDDLAALRERVRQVSVTVARGSAGIGETNAAAELLAALRERRQELLDAPPTYGSVAEKARIAARGAYLDVVLAQLTARADRTDRRIDAVSDELDDFGVDVGDVAEIMAMEPDEPGPRGPLYVTPDGPVDATVSGSPAYLTVAPVSSDRVPAARDGEFHPLVTRNHNLFAAPYGDVADAVVDAVLGDDTDTVDLEVAALALASANRTLDRRSDERLAVARDVLQGAVVGAIRTATANLAVVVATRTNLTTTASRAAVRAALSRWTTIHDRAHAVADGSAARPIAIEVGDRADLTANERDRLRVLLRLELAGMVDDEGVRLDRDGVGETATIVRAVASDQVKSVIEEGANRTAEELIGRWGGEHLVTVPAGLPIAPVPGFWYATANAWNVNVGGTYARFAVSARTGSPDGSTTVTYSRDGRAVELDVFGDGDPVVLGNATRVSFAVTVPVVVVVPPGGSGVGDVDGTADERSDGWDDPVWSVAPTSSAENVTRRSGRE